MTSMRCWPRISSASAASPGPLPLEARDLQGPKHTHRDTEATELEARAMPCERLIRSPARVADGSPLR
jgi:hypothetical protein